jgi:hypothetical protein
MKEPESIWFAVVLIAGWLYEICVSKMYTVGPRLGLIFGKVTVVENELTS